MTRLLTARPLSPDETALLFDEVAGWMESAGFDEAMGVEIEIDGQGHDMARPNPHVASWERPGFPAIERICVAGRRLVQALDRVHARGGTLTCTSRGTIQGPFLEIALMADQHFMSPEASLIPCGLFDGYVPSAGGWSRLIERAGPGRATAFLMSAARIDADLARAAGLCDGIHRADRPRDATPNPDGYSTAAVRLARELAERRSRAGGVTPRQARVLERASFALAFATGDPREGIAAFFEGRPARFAPPEPSDSSHHRDGGTTR